MEANVNEKGLLNDEELKSDAFIFSLAGHEVSVDCRILSLIFLEFILLMSWRVHSYFEIVNCENFRPLRLHFNGHVMN